MSAHAKVLWMSALLAASSATAIPTVATAATPRGLSVDINGQNTWTLTVVNLTNDPLDLVSNSVTASTGQRPPFNGNTLDDAAAFPIGPYQNVTWKSNTAPIAYYNSRWNGAIVVRPHLAASKWSVTVNFKEYSYASIYGTMYGTSVYLTTDLVGNPDWQDPNPGNISCSYPADYDANYNVMTLSGTDYVAALYAPYVDYYGTPAANATLVIRQRFQGEAIHAPCLRYLDNNNVW